jgi:hypothetical protein
MSDDRSARLPGRRFEDAGILIPCSANEFGDFISRLLGKPQTSRGEFYGTFCISLLDVENFFYLLEHRVAEQNSGKLVQFIVAITFDDGTSIELPSLDELRHYSEIKPVISNGVSLTWVYLVTFPGKHTPERQQIDVEFEATPFPRRRVEYYLNAFDTEPFEVVSGRVSFALTYTARTWGTDIENLLRDHILSLLHNERSRFRNFVQKWHKYIRMLFAVIIFSTLTLLENAGGESPFG